jgi:hypothetical protein
MLLQKPTTGLVRLVTSAAGDIECHASWADLNGVNFAGADSQNTPSIVTAATTTIVPAAGAGITRNTKGLYITNNSTSVSQDVAVEHTDGTNVVELMAFRLLPGENMTFNEEGRWCHRDQNGAEYPPAGLGAYTGYPIEFMKSGTAPDALGYWYCTSKDAGFPGAWAPGTPGLAGRATDGTVTADFGCLPIKNPSVGANYLTEMQMLSSVAHQHNFFDCLWVNSGLVVTTTTAQTVNSVALPARDINGTTNGEGCMIAMLFVAASTLAAVGSNLTVSYTNSEGTAGRTATLSAIVGSQVPATPVIGTLVWFNLQSGDKGVRSIQTVTLGTSMLTGTISMMITRGIGTIGTVIAGLPVGRTVSAPGVRLYNGSCILHCNIASAATATFYSGELTIQEK